MHGSSSPVQKLVDASSKGHKSAHHCGQSRQSAEKLVRSALRVLQRKGMIGSNQGRPMDKLDPCFI